MRGNRSELTPARKSPRCHVNSPLGVRLRSRKLPLIISLRFLKLDFLSFSFCGMGEKLFTFLYLLLMMEVVCWLYQTMAFVRMSSGCFLEPSSFLLVFYCTYRAMHWLSLDLICYHGNETYGTCVYQLKDLGQHMQSPWNKHNKSLESFVLNSPDHHLHSVRPRENSNLLRSALRFQEISLLFILINPNSSSSINDVNRSILQY